VTALSPPARPVAAIPSRRPGSARRASHVDMRWPEGTPGDPAAPVVLDAAASDIATSADGTGQVVDAATLRTEVARGRLVTGLEAHPDPGGLGALVGRRAVSGWRAATREVVPGGLLSPLGLLLDDVPIAVLLSFYAGLRAGTIVTQGAAVDTRAMSGHMRDMCAGWATGATPMRSLDAAQGVPLPMLVPVPFDDSDDPHATEPRPPLAPGCLRRARRIEVMAGAVIQVEATFRDSWHDPVDGEGVLHEYVVVAQVDGAGVVLSITAEPRVLPYGECPQAAAAPQRLVGRHVSTAATAMPAELAGTASCTHLNDLLRALTCVPRLAGLSGGARGDDPTP
jgi:hypothetical protein